MDGTTTKECALHNKSISMICLAEECKERLLCSSCFKQHDHSHLDYFLPINEFQDKDGKVILFKDIKQNSSKINKNINEIKFSFYTKIDTLFTKYLKKLKEERFEKFFEEQTKKMGNISSDVEIDENCKDLDEIARYYNKNMKNGTCSKIFDTLNKTLDKFSADIEKKLNNIINVKVQLNINENTKLRHISDSFEKHHYGDCQGRILLDNDSEKIYYVNGHSSNQIEVYSNMDNFKDKILEKTIKLPTYIAGTYSVLHNGYFYFFELENRNKPNNKLIKFDLKTEKIILTKDFEINDAELGNGQNQWGGFNNSILISNSGKLYVVYSSISNKKKINIALINEDNLSITKIWKTDSKIKSACPCIFMIGSVLYHLNSYSKENAAVEYGFDLKTEKSFKPNITFANKGGYDSSLTYYPKINSLMTVNNGDVYVYKVELNEQ